MKTLLNLLFVFLFAYANAQDDLKISGQVLDLETGEEVLFATVALYKNDVLYHGTEADFEGKFVLTHLSKGIYEIEVSFLGYERERYKIDLGGGDREDEKIYLLQQGITCEMVEIVTCGIQGDICYCIACGQYISAKVETPLTDTLELELQEIKTAVPIHVYPNPAIGQTRVSIDSDNYKVIIFSDNGVRVYEGENMVDGQSIDLTGWMPGIYSVVFIKDEKFQFTERLVVVR